jgi:mRNA-degrading endonuclease RelE of RelBE toxin-antitoxin system
MLHAFIHPSAEKELLAIPKEFRLAILENIGELVTFNHPLQHRRVIKLRGRKTKDFRLRVGDYRVEFTLEEPEILRITRIKHRQAGY